MGGGQSLGCKIIDSGNQPDPNSPFTRNTKMFEIIRNSQCTEYTKDEITGLISNTDFVKYLNDSGGFKVPNICFENDQFFGSGKSIKGHQKSYTEQFCNNISNSDDVDYFKFPQDSNFRIFLYGIDPSDIHESFKTYEWGSVSQIAPNQTKAEITRNVLYIAGAFLGVALKSVISTGSEGIYLALKNTATGAGSDAGSASASTATDTAANTSADVGADVGADAGAEAGVDTAVTIATAEAVGEEAIVAASAFGPEGTFVAAAVVLTIVLITALTGFATDVTTANCSYNDKQKPTLVADEVHVGGACCRGQCAIAGTRTACFRQGSNSFNASIFKCCLQDYDCYKNKKANTSTPVTGEGIDTVSDLCFNIEDNEGQIPKISTCHPYTRSLNNQYCSNVMLAYCTGQTEFAENQESLLDAWNPDFVANYKNANDLEFSAKSPCLNFLARLLTGGTALETNICTWDDFVKADLQLSPEILNPVGLDVAQTMLETIINEYIQTHGSPVGKINKNGYLESGEFLTWFYNLCSAYPFLCQVPLTNFCSGYTTQDLIETPESIKWCGCYLQDDQYEKYNQFGIQKQCTPICNQKNNIPLIGDDGIAIPCTESICMIDDTTIKLVNTFTSGTIDFNQVCNSCGGSQISKIYSSSYSYASNTNITNFFELTALDLDDFNIVSNYATKNTSLVGYQEITDGSVPYPIDENTTYLIVYSTNPGKFFPVQFVLGSPIVIPGTDNIIYYIASFTNKTTEDLSKNTEFTSLLSPNNSSSNIFKITIQGGVKSPLPDGKFFYLKINYYQAGETIDNGGGKITQSFLQSIETDVNEYNSSVISRNCNCTVEGNLDFVNDQLGNLDINNNCGSVDCRDSNGGRIPCGNSSINTTNEINVSNTLIASVNDNVEGFNELTISQRTEFITSGTLSLFIILSLSNIFLNYYPRKYIRILVAFMFVFIFTIIFMYVFYTNSFGIDDIDNIFQLI